jgi:hypothetical protein
MRPAFGKATEMANDVDDVIRVVSARNTTFRYGIAIVASRRRMS